MLYFYSLKRIKLIDHGDWCDPEVIYKNKSYNYFDFEDALYDYFKNYEYINIMSFRDFIKNNKRLCYQIINEQLNDFKEYDED